MAKENHSAPYIVASDFPSHKHFIQSTPWLLMPWRLIARPSAAKVLTYAFIKYSSKVSSSTNLNPYISHSGSNDLIKAAYESPLDNCSPWKRARCSLSKIHIWHALLNSEREQTSHFHIPEHSGLIYWTWILIWKHSLIIFPISIMGHEQQPCCL